MMASIVEVLTAYGAQVPNRQSWASMRCPFHDDSRASASVSRLEDRFHCHGCGVSGGPADLVLLEESTNEEAIRVLRELDHKSHDIVSRNKHTDTSGSSILEQLTMNSRTLRVLTDAANQYSTHVEILTDYLAERGIGIPTAKQWQLGYVKSPVLGHETVTGRMSIPYLTPNGVVAMRFRCICGACDDHPKYLGLSGQSTRLFGVLTIAEGNSPSIVITEGEIDAITLNSIGITAVGVPGAKAWKPHYSKIMDDFTSVTVVGDGDQAGHEFVDTVTHYLPDATPVTCPPGDDINSLYVRSGATAVTELLGGDQ